jgi:hypothetical protein
VQTLTCNQLEVAQDQQRRSSATAALSLFTTPPTSLWQFAKPNKEVHMKPAPRSLGRPLAAALALLTVSFSGMAQTFSSGSTGADGAFNPTVNTEVPLPPSGILNYTSMNIPSGVTVTFRRNSTNTPVVLLVQGDATIAGAINLNGRNATDSGAAGNGVLGDDGIPGEGGPGGFTGGRGGASGQAGRAGSGLGPGGGGGGFFVPSGSCWGAATASGTGGGYSSATPGQGFSPSCNVPSVAAGSAYGSGLLLPLIGGSGGGGGGGGTNFAGAGGGGGGGAILIAASGTLAVTGSISANGGAGGTSAGTGSGSGGSGGAGGAIRLVASTISGNGSITALGGGAGSVSTDIPMILWPSVGAPGRIRIEGLTVNRTAGTNPSSPIASPGPLFIPNSPTIRIASVAGQNVPANPTGNADITLPTTTTNPVTVSFESTNVPLGNTIRLTVTPANGDAITAVSTAIAGTLAAGSASVQVTLPQGPSVLQAQTTYTIVASLGDALMNFAANERVERLEITAALGGAPGGVKLVTVSGRTFEATTAALAVIDAFHAAGAGVAAALGS